MIKQVLDYLKARYLDEKAQGMVEYALIIAFVVAIAVYLSSSGSLGTAISSTFDNATQRLNNQ